MGGRGVDAAPKSSLLASSLLALARRGGMDHGTQVVAFGFSPSARALPLRSTESVAFGALSESSLKLGSCRFVRRAPIAGALVMPRKKSRTSKLLQSPFASISFSLASVTATQAAPAAKPATKKKSFSEVISYASQKALSGGIPGMIAMALQVLTLMWLRTTINYQYRYGTTTIQALQTLYKEGGIPRFYNGLGPALIQGPLSRFGDTAANTGVLALLENFDGVPMGVKTIAASLGAGLFRIFLMPVDALKTIMQVEGKNGIPALLNKIKAGGPTVLYHGALAASAATFVGHYPWFFVYNNLNASLPNYTELKMRLLRSAFIGFCSSFVSDCCSNSIRVLKTAKQTSTVPITYPQVVKTIIDKEGLVGLFGRGLGTKLITNGIQGILFSVLWRLGQDYYNNKAKEEEKAKEAAEKAAAAPQPASGKKK